LKAKFYIYKELDRVIYKIVIYLLYGKDKLKKGKINICSENNFYFTFIEWLMYLL
jgi:hypothetical protein